MNWELEASLGGRIAALARARRAANAGARRDSEANWVVSILKSVPLWMFPCSPVPLGVLPLYGMFEVYHGLARIAMVITPFHHSALELSELNVCIDIGYG